MPAESPERILILGGTAEARRAAERLVAEGHHVTTALAGRTAEPALPPGEVRIGGFGGADGLAAWLRDNAIARVIDATHPFARRISQNAIRAATEAGVPLEQLGRPGWAPREGDNWTEVPSVKVAAAALPSGARAFLALGRQYLDAFEARNDCHLVIRMVDPPAGPLGFASYDLVLGKPSVEPEEEAALFRQHGVTHLVCRNSGGEAGYGKIAAARTLRLPVIIIARGGDI